MARRSSRSSRRGIVWSIRARDKSRTSLSFVGFITRTAQHHGQRRAHVALVVDDEDLRHQLF